MAADNQEDLYRSLLADEDGTVRKEWGGKLTIGLIYPNHYRTGMSSLGFQAVYHLFNRRNDVVAERFFLPEEKDMSLHVSHGKGLLSMESLSPLQRFDLLAFSLSFENDYPNILKILDLGKIPLLSKERNGSFPLVMAGGVAAFMNPEPIAPFFDFFLLGEAEPLLDSFVDLISDMARERQEDRKGFFRELARQLPYVYVPSLYRIHYGEDGTIHSRESLEKDVPEKIRVACEPADGTHIHTSSILTPHTAFPEKALIEVGRGCGRGCRFCAAGYVYRPPRAYNESALRDRLESLLKRTDQVGLLSAAISDIPGIERITGFILERGGRFSLSSLRADSLTDGLLEHLSQSGQKSIAIAPEAGSDRLRKVINKHLTRDQIIDAVKRIARKKEFSLRLYFLIGLPTEKKEDIDEIVHLVKSLKHHVVKESTTRGKIGQIRLSTNCFIPKPFTPFQWAPLEDVSSLKAKQKRLRKAVGRLGGVKISFDFPKWAYVQALLSLGDRRVASILMRSYQSGGDWNHAYRHSDVNPDFFVYRQRVREEVLPWDFIDTGVEKEYLSDEYDLALKGLETEPCQVGQCVRCGVCSRT